MYQILCDGYPLFDPRDEDLKVLSPRVKLEANTVGEGSFTILPNHPYFNKLLKLKSVFEVRQDAEVIFRGRMTNDSQEFDNRLTVDLEGALAYTNDTIIPPFSFPADFPNATSAENQVEYFLQWILEQHNAHAVDWQKLKLGKVTVLDPNNTITRSSQEYATTWETLRSKLFESALGGFLNVRYEDDGNYLDYLADFELTNIQRVTYGENLLDLTRQSDATQTYSAIMPFGAQLEDKNGNRYELDLSSLPNGNVTDDVVKEGLYLYSKSAVATYGWICAPVADAKWTDVTIASNLQNKALAKLTGTSVKLSNTIELKALDLHLTDEQIQSFRVCRNLLVDSLPHGLATVSYQLLKMEIDIMDPQNTTITAGSTVRSLTDVSNKQQAAVQEQIENVVKDVAENRESVVEVKNQVVTYNTEVVNTCNEIIMSAMTDYVETGNFEEFQRTVESQLKILADSITMKFTESTNSINDVNGDLQSKFNQLYKYIEFSGDTAITIHSGDSTMTLEIDNESGIVIKQNGVQLGRWCGDTFESGNIIVKVNERAQFGDFAFIPRSDGSLQFLKVGG